MANHPNRKQWRLSLSTAELGELRAALFVVIGQMERSGVDVWVLKRIAQKLDNLKLGE